MIRTTATAAALGVALVLTGCAEAESGGTQATGDTTRSAAPADPSPTAPSEPAATPSPSEPAAPSPAEPEVRTVEITVTGTTVDPAPAQADLGVGETLRLVVTADAGEAVHAHGFGDLEVPVTPGEPTTVNLTGDVPGLYEVELHDPDLLLLQVAVR